MPIHISHTLDVLAHQNLGHLLATFLKNYSVLVLESDMSKISMPTITNSY